MLRARLADTLPFSARRVGAATSDDGVVEARLAINTRIGTGDGFVRLKDGRCWTLLTSLRGARRTSPKASGIAGRTARCTASIAAASRGAR